MARTYTTVQGDMWDVIAKKTLGSEYHMTEIMKINPEHIETVVFPAGVKLTIPDIEQKTFAPPPPWLEGADQ